VNSKANVIFLGSPFWCRHLASLLNEHQLLRAYTWEAAASWIVSRQKSVCLVGLGAPDTYKRFFYHFLAYMLHRFRFIRKRVVYWIGSDVTLLTSNARFVAGCINVAGSAWLAEEVRGKGYACEERLFPIKLPVSEMLPLPETEKLQALCYVPDLHHELHGSAEIRALVEQFSDVEFTVIGGTGRWWTNCPDNIRFTGWTDDSAGYMAAAHVVLRRTAHDSFSAFVREGLVAGRYVIFTYEVPGAIYVKHGDMESLRTRMAEINFRFSQKNLTFNELDPEVRAWLMDSGSQLRALAEDYD